MPDGNLGATRNRRRHPRSQTMLPALLDQYPVTITDISLSGVGSGALEMLADSFDLPHRGQRASLRLLDGNQFSDNIEIEIIRVSSEKGRLGARYVNLSKEQSDMIAGLVRTEEEVG